MFDDNNLDDIRIPSFLEDGDKEDEGLACFDEAIASLEEKDYSDALSELTASYIARKGIDASDQCIVDQVADMMSKMLSKRMDADSCTPRKAMQAIIFDILSSPDDPAPDSDPEPVPVPDRDRNLEDEQDQDPESVQETQRRRPAYRSAKIKGAPQSPADWTRNGCEGLAPEYPINALLADMSAPGIKLTSMKALHFILATAYHSRSRVLDIKTRDLATYMSAINSLAKSSAKDLVGKSVTVAAIGLKRGSSPWEITLIDSIETPRGKLVITLSEELFELLDAPRMYAYVSLDHIRKLDSRYAVAIYPASKIIMRFNAPGLYREVREKSGRIIGAAEPGRRTWSHSDLAKILCVKDNLAPSKVLEGLLASQTAIHKANIGLHLKIMNLETDKKRKEITVKFAQDKSTVPVEYKQRPSGYRKLFRLPAAKEVWVSPGQFADLFSSFFSVELTKQLADDIKHKWMMYLKDTKSETSDAWEGFCQSFAGVSYMHPGRIEDARKYFMEISGKRIYKVSDDYIHLPRSKLELLANSAAKKDLDPVPYLAALERIEKASIAESYHREYLRPDPEPI